MRMWIAALAIVLGIGARSLFGGEPAATTHPAATQPITTQPVETYWAPAAATTREAEAILRAGGFTPPASKPKEPVDISADDALHIFEFRDGATRLKSGWEKFLPKSVTPTPSDPKMSASYEIKKKNGNAITLIDVNRLAARHAIVSISWQPDNPYLRGGPGAENIAMLIVPRTKATDAALGMKEWVKRYAPTYKDVGPGDPWPDVRKQLGKPARTEAGEDGVMRYFYEGAAADVGAVEVDVFDGIVRDVKR